jgi:hypothetical protein
MCATAAMTQRHRAAASGEADLGEPRQDAPVVASDAKERALPIGPAAWVHGSELNWGRAALQHGLSFLREQEPSVVELRAVFPRAGFPALSFNFAKGRPPLARYEHAPRHVIEARYLHDYKVWLEFNDGKKGVVDLADELHGEELEPLRDRERFATFYLDYGLASIAWLEGQDFAPEFLYEKLTGLH